MRSLRLAHPDWAIHAVMVDKPPPGLEADAALLAALAEFDRVVEADHLRIPRFNAWMFKHDVVEACTAVKGQMLVELLEAGWRKVIYLDPDIAVFHPLDAVRGAAGHSLRRAHAAPVRTERGGAGRCSTTSGLAAVRHLQPRLRRGAQ